MDSSKDKRVVLTLDAGGTNFVFSAIQGNNEIIKPVNLPSNADNLDRCFATMINGFETVLKQLKEKPCAISFAFPGPADYPAGIIGDLGNLPAFRGGIPLGKMLENHFGLPVFINNDGNLYAYGEAIAGFLPEINSMLEKAGSPKRYKNLVGFTLGTGFGAGIVMDGQLLIGDNSNGGEAWLLRNKFDSATNIEESISIRAVQRFYAEFAGIDLKDAPEPKDIFDIAKNTLKGDQKAAKAAFQKMAEALGDAISSVITLIDGLVVIGGGVAGAHDLFLEDAVAEMNTEYIISKDKRFRKVIPRVFNLEKEAERKLFVEGEKKEIVVPGTGKTIVYDPLLRTGVGVTHIGTSKAISIGAYAFALNALDKK